MLSFDTKATTSMHARALYPARYAMRRYAGRRLETPSAPRNRSSASQSIAATGPERNQESCGELMTCPMHTFSTAMTAQTGAGQHARWKWWYTLYDL